MNRGLAVLEALRVIKGDVSEEEAFLANAAGWCIEILQAFFLVVSSRCNLRESAVVFPSSGHLVRVHNLLLEPALRAFVPLTPQEDDIMDGSITRRGQPCWYKQEKVGMIAVNDGIVLETLIYAILKVPDVPRHFNVDGAVWHLQLHPAERLPS